MFRSSIEVQGITGEVLSEAVNETGFAVVRKALSERDTERLIDSAKRPLRRWRPSRGSRDVGFHSTMINRLDTANSRVCEPDLTALMEGARIAVQEAAVEADEPALKSWGNRAVPGISYKAREERRLIGYFNRLQPFGSIGDHRDVRGSLGCVVVFSLSEEGNYGLHSIPAGADDDDRLMDQILSEPAQPVTTEPGDALILAAGKYLNNSQDRFPYQYPRHGVINNSDANRFSAALTYQGLQTF